MPIPKNPGPAKGGFEDDGGDFPETLRQLSNLNAQIEELNRENGRLRSRWSNVRKAALFGIIGLILARTVLSAERPASGPRVGTAGPSDQSADDEGRGRSAGTPEAIPPKGLRDVFWRVISEIQEDRVTLVAAGVTYYLLLAIFPALAALVSLYGLIADPSQIGAHLVPITGFLPEGSFEFLLGQLKALTQQKTSSLGIGFFGGLAIALWSARNGTMAIFDAMNVAYEEREKRGIVVLNLIAIAFTLGAIVFAILLISAVAVMPVVLSFLWLDRWTEILALVLRWPILLMIIFIGVVVIYRFGPSREPAKLRWITWGAAFTTLAWTATSFALSYYLNHFANYNITYGTLGALIGFTVWTWISIVILIVGAELNAELELQTVADTTTGTPRPMGARGAVVADTLGPAVD